MIYIKDKFYEDRGSIYTIYNKQDFNIDFVQDKISKSYQGVIRGFHGDGQTWKLITCLHGDIKLITYNIDTDEKLEYNLSGDSKESISVLVPPRVLNAHQCLSSSCIFHYKWSHYYTGPENQWSVNYNDQDINPRWDFSLIRSDFPNAISDRDKNASSLKEFKKWLNKN